MKILNFGSCNIDYVYTVDHIVKPGETITGNRLEIFPGGKGLNQSIAIARAGTKVYHAGILGNDAEILLNTLKGSGADTRYIKTADIKNGHAIIQVNAQGQNSIFVYPGSNDMITTDFVDSVLENFNPGDIILLQNEINNIKYIIDKAYENKMLIALNPSPINEKISEIDFRKLTYIILNEIEAREISGSDNIEEILLFFSSNYPKLKVMLTLGGDGCIYTENGIRFSHPIFKTEVIDTTAAGDTFTGYFISEISKGEKPKNAIKIASCAAAVSVSRKGAAPSIPTFREVSDALRYLREKKNYKQETTYKKINDFIEKNIKTANLDDLSKLLGYSSVYTGRLVNELFGKPFTKLVQDKRCEAAARLLIETDMPIEDVIKSVGYENGTFFRKVFREKYGKNLHEYRNR